MLVLVLSLSLYPCCVPDISKNTLCSSISDDCCASESPSSTDSDAPHSENSNCSPFFACGSCTGFSYITFDIVFSHLDNFISHHNYYQVSNALLVFNEKWQPPKIA